MQHTAPIMFYEYDRQRLTRTDPRILRVHVLHIYVVVRVLEQIIGSLTFVLQAATQDEIPTTVNRLYLLISFVTLL
jgi:flagellin-specific chaperone FliS